ncbi:MAG: RrF2 family transcriptional regulator [Bacteroidales bacterium]
MLSKKTRYALLALTKLAREYGKGTMLIKEIAKSENIPQRFLEGILLDLKNIGFLGSKLGKSGGYYLRKPPEEIKMAEVIRHFDGPIALIPCASEKYYEACEHCKNEESCSIRRVFKDIREQTVEKLSRTSLADLIAS